MKKFLISALFLLFSYVNTDARILVNSKVTNKTTNGNTYTFISEYLSGREVRHYHKEYKHVEIQYNKIYVIVMLGIGMHNGMLIETTTDIPDNSGEVVLRDVYLMYSYSGYHVTGPKPEEFYMIVPIGLYDDI